MREHYRVGIVVKSSTLSFFELYTELMFYLVIQNRALALACEFVLLTFLNLRAAFYNRCYLLWTWCCFNIFVQCAGNESRRGYIHYIDESADKSGATWPGWFSDSCLSPTIWFLMSINKDLSCVASSSYRLQICLCFDRCRQLDLWISVVFFDYYTIKSLQLGWIWT